MKNKSPAPEVGLFYYKRIAVYGLFSAPEYRKSREIAQKWGYARKNGSFVGKITGIFAIIK